MTVTLDVTTQPDARLATGLPAAVPEPSLPPAPPRATARPQDATGSSSLTVRRRVPPVLASRLTAAAVFAGFIVGVAVEPVPNGPQPVLPWWADTLGTATIVALLVACSALAAGRRSGLWAGVVASAGLTTQTLLCPAVGHHTIAAWWWVQLGIGAGMAALCAARIAATRHRPAG